MSQIKHIKLYGHNIAYQFVESEDFDYPENDYELAEPDIDFIAGKLAENERAGEGESSGYCTDDVGNDIGVFAYLFKWSVDNWN